MCYLTDKVLVNTIKEFRAVTSQYALKEEDIQKITWSLVVDRKKKDLPDKGITLKYKFDESFLNKKVRVQACIEGNEFCLASCDIQVVDSIIVDTKWKNAKGEIIDSCFYNNVITFHVKFNIKEKKQVPIKLFITDTTGKELGEVRIPAPLKSSLDISQYTAEFHINTDESWQDYTPDDPVHKIILQVKSDQSAFKPVMHILGEIPVQVEVKKPKNPPMHHEFSTTVAVRLYDFFKAKGISPRGIMLVLGQAGLESSWGKDAKEDYNLFGIMGKTAYSTRSTSHGVLTGFSKEEGYEGSMKYYYSKIENNWPDFLTLIKENKTYTADEIDKALYTGDYYPDKATRNKTGKGAYCGRNDKEEKVPVYYGKELLKTSVSGERRFKESLKYQIQDNTYELATSTSLTEAERKELMAQNKKFKTILNELQ
ncbi:glucosaminidase domain-containing protein [Prevotella sp. 10(H)]|uniref:glucosaminidase domain-containing protein n=1 Tax=Prevotella sp. 10(H) TaxID=1158294 RepID=UPI0004A6D7B5|nr:glucosaminidase domain-containing protein [Prevotella sp. 10(H)]